MFNQIMLGRDKSHSPTPSRASEFKYRSTVKMVRNNKYYCAPKQRFAWLLADQLVVCCVFLVIVGRLI